MARKPGGIVYLDTRGTGEPGTFNKTLRESGFCGVYREPGNSKKGMCMETVCEMVDGVPEYFVHEGDHKSPVGGSWPQEEKKNA